MIKRLARLGFDVLLLLSPLVGYIASVCDKQSGMALMMAYSAPFALVGLRRLYFLIRREKIDFDIRPPAPGDRGGRELTELLSGIHGALKVDKDAKLRLTLFVPNTSDRTLVQVARFDWDGRSEVSQTTIRMGTCSVGHAYNRREIWYVEDVDSPEHGGFDVSLRKSGLTADEIAGHNLKPRRSFAAVPIFTSDVGGSDVVLAVLAADTSKPNAIPTSALTDETALRTRKIQRALLKGRAPIDYEGPPRTQSGASQPDSRVA